MFVSSIDDPLYAHIPNARVHIITNVYRYIEYNEAKINFYFGLVLCVCFPNRLLTSQKMSVTMRMRIYRTWVAMVLSFIRSKTINLGALSITFSISIR